MILIEKNDSNTGRRVEISAKVIFDKFYHKTSRCFGQNFLFNEGINRKIVAVSGDLSGKVVAEIGPGPGGLTLEILKQDVARLYIIEYDRHWANIWRRHIQPLFGDKLVIVEHDALRFDMHEITPDVIISNLPYNISTQLLCRWLPQMNLYEGMILMFQKEVADRICAERQTKAYGKLSVLSQWKAEVSKKFDLEPGCFTPPPKVRSSVVEFRPKVRESTKNNSSFLKFSAFLGDVFSHRRKIISKTLLKYFENPQKILQDLGYASRIRPEDISVEDYCRMFDMLEYSEK